MTSRPSYPFRAFSSAIEILPTSMAEEVRRSFNAARLDPRYAREAADALRLHEFSDGPAYTGYLWDFLADKRVVRDDELWDLVRPLASVYVMWDLHSVERVLIPDDFRFPRGTVMNASPGVIQRGLEYLPEDLYLFDSSYSWAGALTHEYVEDARFCLWSGDEASS
jgi:hypothetical protein